MHDATKLILIRLLCFIDVSHILFTQTFDQLIKIIASTIDRDAIQIKVEYQ